MSDVNVKRVKAFPIRAAIKTESAALPALILKMTSLGFLADLGPFQPKTGAKMEISFELPVVHHNISSHVIVVKTYNQLGPGQVAPTPGTPASNIHCIGEMHFRSLSDADREQLSKFLEQANRR